MKKDLKDFLAHAFYMLKGYRFAQYANLIFDRRITIVTYHRVTDQNIHQNVYSLPYLFITTETLEKHLTFFKEHYTVIGLSNLSEWSSHRKIDKPALIITFDDGYEDIYRHAYPIFKKYALPWTLFISSGFIGTDKVPWWDEIFYRLKLLYESEGIGGGTELDKQIQSIFLQFKNNPARVFAMMNHWDEDHVEQVKIKLDQCVDGDAVALAEQNRFLRWEHLDELQKHADIGSHTKNHVVLTSVDRDIARREIAESKVEIEGNLRCNVLAFAYPAGKYNQEIIDLVRQADYKFAVTQEKGTTGIRSPFCLKRINLWEASALDRTGNFSEKKFHLKMLGL